MWIICWAAHGTVPVLPYRYTPLSIICLFHYFVFSSSIIAILAHLRIVLGRADGCCRWLGLGHTSTSALRLWSMEVMLYHSNQMPRLRITVMSKNRNVPSRQDRDAVDACWPSVTCRSHKAAVLSHMTITKTISVMREERDAVHADHRVQSDWSAAGTDTAREQMRHAEPNLKLRCGFACSSSRPLVASSHSHCRVTAQLAPSASASHTLPLPQPFQWSPHCANTSLSLYPVRPLGMASTSALPPPSPRGQAVPSVRPNVRVHAWLPGSTIPSTPAPHFSRPYLRDRSSASESR